MATTKKTPTPKTSVAKVAPTKSADFSIFSLEVSPSLLAQAIHIYRENSHRGVAKTKTRGEIDMTKHKVYKQKGTGNARHGAKSSPIYVGGGVAFGPTGYKTSPMSFNQKMKVKALLGILSLYNKEGRLFKIDSGSFTKVSTKNALSLFGKDNAALVHYEEPKEFLSSVSNLEQLSLYSARRLNVYNVALSPKIYFTDSALNYLTSRLKLNK